MNRRDFISGMIAAAIAPTFLPGAGRIWKPVYPCSAYIQYMLRRSEEIDQLIVQDIMPSHEWSGMVIAGEFPRGVIDWVDELGASVDSLPPGGEAILHVGKIVPASHEDHRARMATGAKKAMANVLRRATAVPASVTEWRIAGHPHRFSPPRPQATAFRGLLLGQH